MLSLVYVLITSSWPHWWGKDSPSEGYVDFWTHNIQPWTDEGHRSLAGRGAHSSGTEDIADHAITQGCPQEQSEHNSQGLRESGFVVSRGGSASVSRRECDWLVWLILQAGGTLKPALRNSRNCTLSTF